MGLLRTAVLAGLLLPVPSISAAQDRERSTLDISGGYAGFLDESAIGHHALGGAWRWRATPRLSFGPEIVYMRGPGRDRDLFITGKLIVDFLPRRNISPYFVADGGIMLHADDFYSAHREGAVSLGGGVRVDLTDRLFIAPEFRIGWEPHVRVTAVVGWRLPSTPSAVR